MSKLFSFRVDPFSEGIGVHKSKHGDSKGVSFIIKALTVLMGGFSLNVGLAIGLEWGRKTVPFNP